MASRRISRTKSFSSYLSSINDDVSILKSRRDITGQGIAAGAVSGSALSDEITLVSNGISSDNYIPNYSGWRISGSGVAEFSDVFVRGDINAETGTIGYWNISSPAVKRVFGSSNLYGTFLESSDIGDSDADKTSGTYVGLYKSYEPQTAQIIAKYRKNGIATISSPNHPFIVGDVVYVSVDGDLSFGSPAIPVSVIDTTPNTISYINDKPDYAEIDVTTGEPLDNSATGTITLYTEDVAGLYLRDYSKREFDYGYFSNQGVSYVSAEDINLVENPSLEYVDSSNVLQPSSASWGVFPVSGSNLTFAVQSYSSFTRPYKNSTSYGGYLSWTSTTSNYLGVNIDYSAGTQYGVLGLGRNLYFGARIFPNFGTLTSRTISTIDTYNLTGTFTSANSTATTITYTGSGLGFQAGQYLTVTGFTGTNASRFNITNTKIQTANSTTVTVDVEGTVESSSTGTGSASSGLLKVVTSTNHGFSVGDTVFLDVDAGYDSGGFGEVSDFYVPHALPDGSRGYTYTICASPVSSPATTFYVITENGVISSGVNTFLTISSHYSIGNTTPRPTLVYKTYEAALDLTSIRIRYPNSATTTPISNVVSTGTLALWNSGIDKYAYVTANAFTLGYLDPAVKIPAMTVPSTIIFDGASIDAAYLAIDSAGQAAKSDIYLDIPGWLVLHDGNGVVPSSPTKIASAGYIIDNVFLSTATNFFYGSDLSTNRWYATTDDVISYNPAQASVEAAKTWINIDLENQSAFLDYFDYIGFRNNTFSKPMVVRPSIGLYDTASTYITFPDADKETTTLSGGQYQYLSGSTYVNISPSLKLITGDSSTSFELSATLKTVSVGSGTEKISNAAVIAGIFDQTAGNLSTIYSGSDKFVWTSYPSLLTNEAYASVIFTRNSANFTQKIRSNSSITTATGFSGSTLRLSSTAAYSLSSTSHPMQIGPTNSDNLRLDDNGIQAVSNGSAAALNINTFGGTVNTGTPTSTFTVNGYLRVVSNNDVSLTSTNHPLQLGPTNQPNLRLDGNEIQAANNGAANTLNLQASGGDTVIGAGGGDVTIGNSTTSNSLILGSTAGTPNTQLFYKWGYSSNIGNARPLSIASTGLVGYTTSSKNSKQNIENLLVDASSVLSVIPKKFKYKIDVENYGDAAETSYGFIAEDLDELGLRPFVDYDENGKPFGIDYAKYVVALQAVVRHQASQIEILSNRLDALEGK